MENVSENNHNKLKKLIKKSEIRDTTENKRKTHIHRYLDPIGILL